MGYSKQRMCFFNVLHKQCGLSFSIVKMGRNAHNYLDFKQVRAIKRSIYSSHMIQTGKY